MGFILTFSFSWIIELVVLAMTVLYAFYQYKFLYWGKRNVEHEEPNFLWGNLKGFPFTKSLSQIMTEVYNKRKTSKYVGMWFFFTPTLFVKDLDIIKNILVRDFKTFRNRGTELDLGDVEPLTEHLFSLADKKWRNLRVKLTPAFTSGKIKMMFSVMLDIGEQLKMHIEKSVENEIDIKAILSRYMMDVISSCAFGLDSNCMGNPDSQFYLIGQELVEKPSTKQLFSGLAYGFARPVAKFFKIRLLAPHITDFFLKLVKDTIEMREREKITRNDFMQLLIELVKKGYIEDADMGKEEQLDVQKFTVEQVAAQIFIFFFAGFEPTAGTLQYALYEISLNEELQKSVQNEVDDVLQRHNNKITYDNVHEMDLLGRIVSETLRKYSVVQHLFRQASDDYKIDDDGEYVLEKKMAVVIPVAAIHKDPDFYPDPDKFDPDRFLPEIKANRHHFAYLPFGDGPRNCIGNRFALMQIKTTLAILLSKFTFTASAQTPIPLEFDPALDFLVPKKKIFLNIYSRT